MAPRRQSPGLGRRLPVLLAALFLPAGAGSATAFTPFPVASLGDIWFQVDQSAFREPDLTTVHEFTLRITNNQLEFTGEEEEAGEQQGRVSVELTFLDADEEKLGEASREFEFVVPDPEIALSADHAELLVMREELDPRTRFVKVEVSDLNARKRGLLYMVTGKRRNGEAVGAIEPPPFGDQELATSDLQFAWIVERATEDSPWLKNGYNVIPNPSRAFGLLQPTVSAYFEVYDQREFPGPRAYVIDHAVVNNAGSVVLAMADTVSSRVGFWARTASFDGSRLPTGRYVLRTTVRDLIGEDRTTTERDFNLVWGTDAWDRTEEDVLDEARVLFTEDEYNRFRGMSIADRELYLAQFWADHDPSPTTPGNELRDEFLRRVDYANLHFSAFGRKGMITDRGRIYVRFGEPDEIETELVPTRDNQLDQLVGELSEESITGGRLGSADEFDTRPYIIWNYTVQGRPLFPEREFGTSVTGLRFVFVDDSGTGSFVLRYASDFINY